MSGQSVDELRVRELHRRLLDSWNQADAEAMAALYADDGYQIGFDGSHVAGPQAIAAALAPIFKDHVTATFVAKIRSVTFLSGDVAVLLAAAGMVLPGKAEIEPARNVLQTLVATRRTAGRDRDRDRDQDDQWQVAVFQNTPAQFHGRPEAVKALTDELEQVRASSGVTRAE